MSEENKDITTEHQEKQEMSPLKKFLQHLITNFNQPYLSQWLEKNDWDGSQPIPSEVDTAVREIIHWWVKQAFLSSLTFEEFHSRILKFASYASFDDERLKKRWKDVYELKQAMTSTDLKKGIDISRFKKLYKKREQAMTVLAEEIIDSVWGKLIVVNRQDKVKNDHEE